MSLSYPGKKVAGSENSGGVYEGLLPRFRSLLLDGYGALEKLLSFSRLSLSGDSMSVPHDYSVNGSFQIITLSTFGSNIP